MRREILLRWIQVDGEEQEVLANLVRVPQDPRVVTLAKDLMQSRSRLALTFHGEKKEPLNQIREELEKKELDLRKLSRRYNKQLRVQSADLDDVRYQLPKKGALLVFREFQEADHKNMTGGSRRLTAMLLREDQEDIRFFDLGEAQEIQAFALLLSSDLDELPEQFPDEKTQKQVIQNKLILEQTPYFYQKFFSPLEKELEGIKTLYLVPDGLLRQVPFAALKVNEEEYWIQKLQIRRLQTLRDLLRLKENLEPVKGLLAMGGVTYSELASPNSKTGKTRGPSGENPLIEDRNWAQKGNRNLNQQVQEGFSYLEATETEIAMIKIYYEKRRPDETATLLYGSEASEEYLKNNKIPPRVLHLATHGFFLEKKENEVERPLLLSGLALAGANKGRKGTLSQAGEDGILYSLEVLGLNLEGTELVTLSACKTGHGVQDYSEGVMGLVRAFRIAGAQRVLMTLKSVDDNQAKDFMIAFYQNWLNKPNTDPADALRQTKLDFLQHKNPEYRDPKVWSPYILVE